MFWLDSCCNIDSIPMMMASTIECTAWIRLGFAVSVRMCFGSHPVRTDSVRNRFVTGLVRSRFGS
eukprot:11190192-Lingulodinium_polyedra.AAC.1